jgi:hypothetical protein
MGGFSRFAGLKTAGELMTKNLSSKLDNDAMNMADPTLVGRAAMTVIDQLQDFTPEVQTVGFAAAFLLLCERFHVHPGNVFLTAQNVMNGMDGKRPEFAAVRSYLGEEI